MTINEWERIKRWFKKHETYWTTFVGLGMFAIMGQLIMYDAIYDGGSVYDPHNWEMPADADNSIGAVWDGKTIGDKYPEWQWGVFGIFLTIPFFVWIWSLPINTFLLKCRRRDFFTGEKRPSRRELKVKERERQVKEAIAEVRKVEREYNLEPYEFGSVSR